MHDQTTLKKRSFSYFGRSTFSG